MITIKLPADLKRLGDDSAKTGGALDPNQVMIQFLCTTDGGGHDPEGTPDDRVRPSHAALHGSVWRLDDPQAPIPPLDYGCFLPGAIVRGTFDGASRARYHGQAIEIRTQNGAVLRVTPNHPIPTEYGLIYARALKPGWKLLTDSLQAISVASQHVDEDDQPTTVEQAYDLLAQLGPVDTARNTPDHFHGDGQFVDGQVDVAGSYATLSRVWNAQVGQELRDHQLAQIHAAGYLPSSGFGDHGAVSGFSSGEFDAGGDVSVANLRGSLSLRHGGPLQSLLLRLRAQLDALGQQSPGDGSAIDAESFGERIDGLPLAVQLDQAGNIDWRQMQCLRLGKRSNPDTSLLEPDKDGLALHAVPFAEFLGRSAGTVRIDQVAEITRFDYSGHVYDLRSPLGYVIANGVIASNCRCSIRYTAQPDTRGAEILGEEATVDQPAETSNQKPYAAWLDENVPNWKSIAQAAANVEPQERLNKAYLVAKKLGAADARAVAKMAVEASPYLMKPMGRLGVGELSGVGKAGRALVERWRAGDMEAAAKLAKSYPATYSRLLAEGGPLSIPPTPPVITVPPAIPTPPIVVPKPPTAIPAATQKPQRALEGIPAQPHSGQPPKEFRIGEKLPPAPDYIVAAEKQILRRTTERGLLFDKNGKLIGDGEGTGSETDIEGDWDKAKDGIVTHNHPDDGKDEGRDWFNPPSDDDVKLAIENDLAAIRAVTPQGVVYEVARPPKGWPAYSTYKRKMKAAYQLAWERRATVARQEGRDILRMNNLTTQDHALEILSERGVITYTKGRHGE